ncbi:precorrin methylase [Epibacterium sp. SM1969]|uniref:Precorrin methylase n=1 Tax=Tritonibacter aquimaris TaxID=2663379 RepID=A0A844AQM2_9RHOB|nr:cobalamin biosynthesis protein [Tritonibacter aquimaris]MQY43203.1 precorrin methylase [Tritonibacter aquimaris]
MKIAGLGFRRSVTPAALADALAQLGTDVDQIAVLETKAQVAGFARFAPSSDIPVVALNEADIKGIKTQTQSTRVYARFGTGSVAEALAIAAARQYGSARLICPRYITADGSATAALAEVHTQ